MHNREVVDEENQIVQIEAEKEEIHQWCLKALQNNQKHMFEDICVCINTFALYFVSCNQEKREKGKEERAINTDYYRWGGYFLCSCVKGTPQTLRVIVFTLGWFLFFKNKIHPVVDKLKHAAWT